MKPIPFLRTVSMALVAMLGVYAQAQTAGGGAVGTVVGRIINLGTGEYLRDADIRILGGEQRVASEEGGHYRLAGVTAGSVTIVVSYTGYATASRTVRVNPGATVTQDFQLAPFEARGKGDEVVALTAFVVSSERDGNAKAIMDQRRSMDIKDSVASDTFTSGAQGNVGEFIKNLPGIELDYVEGTARNFRLRGLGTEFSAVTIDGVTLASADANGGAAGNARAFSFDVVSLDSLDSIEISKTISADVDANAPAGRVNLRSKRAFDRDGRRFGWEMKAAATSDHLSFARTSKPYDTPRRKILPGGSVEFSDVFFNKRLGLVLNISDARAYTESNRLTTTYNYTPTAADPRPAVVTTLSAQNGPILKEVFSAMLTTDFKVTPDLALGLGVIYNYSDSLFLMAVTNFNSGTRSTVVGADPLVKFATTSVANVAQSEAVVAKLGRTITAKPRIDYKIGNLLLESRWVASSSISTYDPMGKHGAVRNGSTGSLAGISFEAARSSLVSGDWQIRQLSGPDWVDGSGFRNPTTQYNDGRYARTIVYSGALDATYKQTRGLPIVWKVGAKRSQEQRQFEVRSENLLYAYTGPGGGTTGSWGALPAPYTKDLSAIGGSIASVSGGDVFKPNLYAISRLFLEHPEYFTRTFTASNYYNANLANKKRYQEEIDGVYAMATTEIKRLRLRGGMRWEDTRTDSLEFDPLPASQVKAAGFPVATTGRASTIPGLEYQFLSQPRIHRQGGYDNFFPSASAKYRLQESLDCSVGYSHTIRRPTFRDISGVWVINEDAETVTVPNPNLRPEISDNVSARLAYYFEPAGTLGISVSQNEVKGAAATARQTAEQFGYGNDPEFASYTFITTASSDAKTTIRGLEVDYRQTLVFLPGVLRGITVYANYTRNYATAGYPNVTPHSAKTGWGHRWRGFSSGVSMTWSDDMLNSVPTTSRMQWQRHRTLVDCNLGYQISRHTTVFANAINVFNAPLINMEQNRGSPAVATYYGRSGTRFTLGVRGRY